MGDLSPKAVEDGDGKARSDQRDPQQNDNGSLIQPYETWDLGGIWRYTQGILLFAASMKRFSVPFECKKPQLIIPIGAFIALVKRTTTS